ncbi:MAG TPA: ABC transporter ATP-binding protein [Steroidobacteraceae bacterium]|nr:ABC transporter ATP-binding protein [Steroidobacteraceae bacterium]
MGGEAVKGAMLDLKPEAASRKTRHAPRPEAPPLVVEGLSHAFGPRQALCEVSFELDRGDRTVLLGLNGAGKTTLFSLITRLYNHRGGSIRIFGWEIKQNPSEALARLGVVFQLPTLDPDLSVAQNLFYHAALHGLPRREAAARITREIERVGLTERMHEKARTLSGGQRRRVEIARALIHRPKMLLLDEATVGLDIASRQFLLDHVRMLCREEGLAVLWATHLIDEVDSEARVIVLHKGRILAKGPVPEVIRQADAASIREAFDRLTGERGA